GQPDGIEPPALGGIDLLEGGGECFGLALARAPLELVEHAEFECHLSFLLSYCHLPARAKTGWSVNAGMISRANRRMFSREPPKFTITYSTPPFRRFSS